MNQQQKAGKCSSSGAGRITTHNRKTEEKVSHFARNAADRGEAPYDSGSATGLHCYSAHHFHNMIALFKITPKIFALLIAGTRMTLLTIAPVAYADKPAQQHLQPQGHTSHTANYPADGTPSGNRRDAEQQPCDVQLT